MKKQNVFMALFLAAFMLLFFGSVSSAHDPNIPPPSGEHHDPNMPPMGMHSSLESHCGEIKTSNEKKRMRKKE